MDYYLVSDLKESVKGILTGLNTNNVIDLEGKARRAAVTLLMKADVPEMEDVYALNTYDGVFDYIAPPNVFGSLIKDVRPQGVSRSPLDVPYKKPLQDFDLMKQTLSSGVMVTFEQRKTSQIMRLANTRNEALFMIDTMTDDTLWTVSGDASGLAVDRTNFYDSPASLRFNLAAGGTQGLLTQTFSSQSDLSAYDGVGVIFLAVYLPNVTAITSIAVQLGNDSTHHWNVSTTTGFLGAWVANNWLLVALDLANKTADTGVVDNTKIDYVQLQFNYTSTTKISNVRIGGMWISLPTPTEIVHETSAIFIPQNSSTPQKTITTNNDQIMLGDAAYNLYAYEFAREIALGKGATAASGIIAGIDLVLEGDGGRKLGLYQKFRGDNPAQTLRQIGSYYDIRKF